MHQYADTELVDKIRQGDVRSFERAFRLYGEDLVRYAATILKDADEAEDVVQQLFVQLWAKRDTLVVTTSLKSYLYRSVHNGSLNRIKQENVKQSYAAHFSYVSNVAAQAASYETERKEVSIAIDKAIDELPEQCRLIFKMSRFEQLKYQEIALKLGISVKTVENQMGKALKHMREKLRTYMTIILYLLFFHN